jgi:hypothetical protein
MGTYIIHKDGAYNIYTEISDGPYFEQALTLTQLEDYTRRMEGENGLAGLPRRLQRAHATGCSAIHTLTLEECIRNNRAGPREGQIPVDEFIRRFLTLPAEDAP